MNPIETMKNHKMTSSQKSIMMHFLVFTYVIHLDMLFLNSPSAIQISAQKVRQIIFEYFFPEFYYDTFIFFDKCDLIN